MFEGRADAWSATALSRVATTPHTFPPPTSAGGDSFFPDVEHSSPPEANWRRCRHQCASFKSASAHTIGRSPLPTQSVSWGALSPGLPKFLGNPNCPFAHVPIRRRQDCLHQTVHSAAAWPLVEQKQRLPRKVFRRSIAWLSDSLSTLRRTGYPATTQDSLPAAGQALPDGLSTRKVPMKGFRFASLHFIPLVC